MNEIGKGIDYVKDLLSEQEPFKKYSKTVDNVAMGLKIVTDSMYEVSDASAQLAVKTGLSESALKKYQGIMQEVKSNNYGKDYTDIASALGEVVQTMGDMNPSAMSAATESAIALRDILGLEVSETVKAADVLMQTMGVDAEKAFALIAAGAQNGLNSSGELLDTIVDNSKGLFQKAAAIKNKLVEYYRGHRTAGRSKLLPALVKL